MTNSNPPQAVRAADFDDLPALVELARLYHGESHGDWPFDPDHTREQFRARTIDTMDGVCLLLEHDRAIVGFLAAALSTHVAAPVRIALELAWYVESAHRGRGGVLIDEFESWARWKGCAVAALSLNELRDERRTAALVRFYERRGYCAFERAFVKRF